MIRFQRIDFVVGGGGLWVAPSIPERWSLAGGRHFCSRELLVRQLSLLLGLSTEARQGWMPPGFAKWGFCERARDFVNRFVSTKLFFFAIATGRKWAPESLCLTPNKRPFESGQFQTSPLSPCSFRRLNCRMRQRETVWRD